MAEEPPYVRIAGEYRRRIASGELRPGDRLPSTRALAAEWGVALATAAKALTELRLSGVVRTQARVGTVVAPPPRSAQRSVRSAAAPASGSADLTRERVIRTAVAIADAEGIDGLSMRAVAARLGASTMSLYGHVRSKDELVRLMADHAYGEASFPDDPPEHWRARLELGARTLWRVYVRHPWLAQLGPLARPLMLPNLLRHGEFVLRALNQLGLPAERVLDLQIVLFNHGQAFAVNLEREALARADTGLTDDQWVDLQEPELQALAGSGEYPELGRMITGLRAGYDFDLDNLFDTGLQALLDGFERLVERETGTLP